jgi:hypothetical protein
MAFSSQIKATIQAVMVKKVNRIGKRGNNLSESERTKREPINLPGGRLAQVRHQMLQRS